jgi:hypothetical protein
MVPRDSNKRNTAQLIIHAANSGSEAAGISAHKEFQLAQVHGGHWE